MNRREFLTLGAGAAGGLLLPGIAKAGLFHEPGHVLWGAFARPAGNETFIDANKRTEKLIGRKLGMTRHYVHWTGPFLTDTVKWSAKGGRIPFIAFSTNGSVTWKEIKDGSQDDHLRQRAHELKKWGKHALFCFDHEPESMANTFGAGTPDEFAAAYDHTHRIFNEVGVRNVKWVCVLQGGTFAGGHGGSTPWFPRSHQILGSDGYNRHSDDWVSFEEIFSPGYHYARGQNKPFFIGEWGCQADRRKPQWFLDAAVTMKSWKYLRAVIYTNALCDFNGAPVDFRVNSSWKSQKTFSKIGHDSYFGGTQ